MENKNHIVAGIVGLVALGVAFLVGHPNIVVQPPEVKVQNVGSVASPDIPSPYFSYGDVRHWAAKEATQTATNTICAMQSPAATSTLLRASVRLDISSTTASQVEIRKGATAFATTTALSDKFAIAANAQILVSASSTSDSLLNSTFVFAPNQWVNVSMVTTDKVGNMSPTGNCEAIWVEN